jgi:hypothetical protein
VEDANAKSKCLISALQSNCRSKILSYEIHNFITSAKEDLTFSDIALKAIELSKVLTNEEEESDVDEEKAGTMSILQVDGEKLKEGDKKRCYVCKSEEHLKRDCPQHRANQARSTARQNNYNNNCNNNTYSNWGRGAYRGGSRSFTSPRQGNGSYYNSYNRPFQNNKGNNSFNRGGFNRGYVNNFNNNRRYNNNNWRPNYGRGRNNFNGNGRNNSNVNQVDKKSPKDNSLNSTSLRQEIQHNN